MGSVGAAHLTILPGLEQVRGAQVPRLPAPPSKNPVELTQATFAQLHIRWSLRLKEDPCPIVPLEMCGGEHIDPILRCVSKQFRDTLPRLVQYARV